jgi:hypothetical protein
MKTILTILSFAFLISGCDKKSPDRVQSEQQEIITAQGNASVGMPSIVNFQEKRILKDIYEMRDKVIMTVTYTQDMNGKLHKLCDSVGFGISAATQYTNPQKIVYGNVVTPQADPNGLFSPTSTLGTWVMCKNPKGNDVSPVYSEPNIIVSKFRLE